MKPFPAPEPPSQEELDYWEARRAARLAKHPIDYDALEAAVEASDEDEEEEDEEEDEDA
jgi:hypothetical protein